MASVDHQPAHSLIHELKGAVSDEIVRRGNQQAAVEAMNTEQGQRVQANRMAEVLDALLSGARRAAAAQAQRSEQISRVAESVWKYQVLAELASVSARREAAAATEIERSHRMQNQPGPSETHSHARIELREAIDRMGAVAAARADAEIARAEQIHTAKMESICDDIVRNVARKNVRTAVETERMEQITTDRLHNVCDELRRAVAVVAVANAVAAEQAQQVEQLQQQSSATGNAVAVSEYYGDAVMAAAKASVTEDISRLGARRDAALAAEVEQESKRIRSEMLKICEQIEREHNRREAVKACDTEHAQRITKAKMNDVCTELRFTAGREEAANAAAEEQRRRVESGVTRTYWVVDPAAISEAKNDINEAIARLGSVASAKDSAESERLRRMHCMVIEQICDEVRRKVAQQKARADTELEQAQRISTEMMHEVCAEVRRAASIKSAIDAAHCERTRRTSFTDKAPIVSPEKTVIQEEIVRIGNRKTAVAAMEVERAMRIQEDHMRSVCSEITSREAQRVAEQACTELQESAITQERMNAVLGSLVRRQSQKDVSQAMEAERKSRMTSPPIELDAETQDKRAAVLEQINMAPRAC